MTFQQHSGIMQLFGLNADQNKILRDLVAKTEKVVKLDPSTKLLWIDANVNSPENMIY